MRQRPEQVLRTLAREHLWDIQPRPREPQTGLPAFPMEAAGRLESRKYRPVRQFSMRRERPPNGPQRPMV
jgi:hypothetical protein